MGLIDVLGLRPTRAMLQSVQTAGGVMAHGGGPGLPAGRPAPANPLDPLDAQLGRQIDELTALLDQVHDDAAAAAARTDLHKLIDGRAQAATAAPPQRAAALRALSASAAQQKPKVEALLRHAQAVERREAARKEIEVRLGQVRALVLGGISDDGLRRKIDAELGKAQAAYAQADKIADFVAGERALRALLPGALALLARAEKARQVADWFADRWQPQRVKAGAAVGALVAPALTVLQANIDALDKEALQRVAAADLAGLEAALPKLQRIETLALRVGSVSRDIDAQLAGVAQQLAAMGTEAPPALADRLADLQRRKGSGWPAGKTPDAIEAAVAELAAAVTALVAEVDAARKIVDAHRAYVAAYAAMRADVEQADRVHATPVMLLSEAIANGFASAKQAVDDAVLAADWARASAALPALKQAALAVKKAVADERTFRAALAPLLADLARVRGALKSPGLPPAAAGAFRAADTPVTDAEKARDWPAAGAAVPPLKAALQAALAVLADGRKFYDAFVAVKADHDAAQTVVDTSAVLISDVTLSGLAGQFNQAKENLDQKIATTDWSPATRMLPDLQAKARELVAAQARHDAASAAYDRAKAAVPVLWDTESLKQLSPASSGLVIAWKQTGVAVHDAEHAGDFVRALAALPAWKKANDDLLSELGAQIRAKVAFDAAFNALTDYAEAMQIAAGPVPALVNDAQAFKSADNLIANARKVRRWDTALANLPALQAAARQLLAGKAAFNANAGPQDRAAFDARLKVLEPRVAKAHETPVTPHVQSRQQAVVDRRSEIDDALTAQDLAAAEASFVKLGNDLDAMEAAKQRQAQHQASFDAARNGAVAAVRALVLKPPALAAERTAGLAATEAEIVAQAGKGEFDRAAALIARWLQEAQGWKESPAAYAELHDGKVPDVGKLAALAKQPGGEEVLDAMIMKLPPDTPARVLSAALKARFGFEIRRFKDMNTNETNLKGLSATDAKAPDPELVQVYKLLAQIPSKHIKGKISELIDFDVDDGAGAYYRHDRRVYVHSGRVGDLKSGEKTLGNDVMPEGEEVDETCKPASAEPVPISNFTLLHEAAHAEDRATRYMDSRKGENQTRFGAWVDESPQSIARKAAKRFRFDEDYIRKTLEDKNCNPPKDIPQEPDGVKRPVWEARQREVLHWCQAIRASATPWSKGAVCKQVAIEGRVYQESYNDGRWSSYPYAARSQGISGYQFRAAPEWFAELYAAFFSKKLKPSHPAMTWLKDFKSPQP